MLQLGYIILIIGAVLLISGIVVSVFWAGSFASSFLRQGLILNDVAIPPGILPSWASTILLEINNPNPVPW